LSGGFALVWIVAATLRPTFTFHLAPVLIVITPSVLVGSATDRASTAMGLEMALVVALAAATVLKVAGRLQGPSLLPVGGAYAEAAAFAPVAVLVCFLLQRRGPRRETEGTG
jgi:hypothetical protein